MIFGFWGDKLGPGGSIRLSAARKRAGGTNVRKKKMPPDGA